MRVVVGVQGVQGCGKSTMCARIAREDATVDTVSLDDFYLSKEDRCRLSKEVSRGLQTYYRCLPR